MEEMRAVLLLLVAVETLGFASVNRPKLLRGSSSQEIGEGSVPPGPSLKILEAACRRFTDAAAQSRKRKTKGGQSRSKKAKVTISPKDADPAQYLPYSRFSYETPLPTPRPEVPKYDCKEFRRSYPSHRCTGRWIEWNPKDECKVHAKKLIYANGKKKAEDPRLTCRR